MNSQTQHDVNHLDADCYRDFAIERDAVYFPASLYHSISPQALLPWGRELWLQGRIMKNMFSRAMDSSVCRVSTAPAPAVQHFSHRLTPQFSGKWRFALALAPALMAMPGLLSCSVGENTTTFVGEAVANEGELHLQLTAVSESNTEYRLMDAVFTIVSLTSDFAVEVATDNESTAETLLVQLPAGPYLVFLEPGHSLERVPNGDGPTVRAVDKLPAGGLLASGRSRRPASEREVRSVRPLPLAPEDVVDAVLLSENPALVEVQSQATTPLSFVFEVDGEVVGDPEGVLALSIEVLERRGAGAECSDEFEPNEELDQAAVVSIPPIVEAVLCGADRDVYQFEPPGQAGDGFFVTVGFSHDLGDVDVELFNSSGEFVDGGFSVTDNETVFAVSDGQPFLLGVTLFGFASQPVPYTVDVIAGDSAGANSCCETSPLPGCSDPVVEQCVCAADAACCAGLFDETCVSIANFQCQAGCFPPPEGDCCSATDELGCAVAEVSACVCAIDSQCCSDGFDDRCVQEAIAECGASCPVPEPQSDCCTASDAPGCVDPAVQACVCDLDPLCCANAFDENCVSLAVSQCAVTCAG